MSRIFNIGAADPSWHACIHKGLSKMDPKYLDSIQNQSDWLPGHDDIFRAFSLPLSKTRFILLGESPYPRAASANGYAFWDAAVDSLWSPTGLHKSVNRATSLRNMIKMLLIAEGLLKPGETTQENIASLDKTGLVQSGSALFGRFLSEGFLLLNATPVLRSGKVQEDAKAWKPFTEEILLYMSGHRPDTRLILFGRIAGALGHAADPFTRLIAEHPYNLSFISNDAVLQFFRPLSLLKLAPDTIKASSRGSEHARTLS